ncbi:DUF3572 domain-containing protein [Kaistia algarum]|uniref:DUF3572 domain-containing protein n=1 Tax=Kaistia algarum TaxID=2083279 RepID=UPI000CE74E0D|nr:DUF3572 domain-containing protein [Kaistia algarum]MCX5516265.1 DUF3572 domain-containing protein [Kaistia algarum]PPE78811.1 DUF3572 domain-containing protein [Kaistia algarum]
MIRDRKLPLSRDEAESLAIRALAYLAEEPEELGRFLALVGLGPENLRAAAADGGFLAGVLEYFMASEPLLLVFCARENVRPTLFAAARYLLDDESR